MTQMWTACIDELYQKVKSLNELLWEQRANRPVVEQWLNNFKGELECEGTERAHALYLLSKFLFLGRHEVRRLLRAMFVELVRHPLTSEVRARLNDPVNFEGIHQEYLSEIERTRFLGLGNPSESGTHILYDFRHANKVPTRYFVAPHELFTDGLSDPTTEWKFRDVRRLIFIDDFCGTGAQARDVGTKYVPLMRQIATRSNVNLEVWYLTLLATTTGLTHLRQASVFDHVECVSEMDASYRAFDVDSQFYVAPPSGITKTKAEEIARRYGERLQPGFPLGYGNCQLLVGFHHNVPDNTLPIISHYQPQLPWYPVFPRDEKY